MIRTGDQYRDSIRDGRQVWDAHLTAAVALAEHSPGWPPDAEPITALHGARAGLFAAERDDAPLPRTVRRADLRHPRFRRVPRPGNRTVARKILQINADWRSEDRRRLLAFARDLLNSDYAGHRLTFQLFAQSPPFANLAAVYRNFDWEAPLRFVHKSAGLSGQVPAGTARLQSPTTGT